MKIKNKRINITEFIEKILAKEVISLKKVNFQS